MKRKKIPRPTESELSILHILWKHGPSTVREVNDMLSQGKEVGYTTTLKFMQIMADKGLVTRDTSSRTHIYKATVEEADTQGNLLASFLDTTFKGSAMNLVMQALGNHNTTKEELKEIKKLIKKLEQNK